MVRQQNIQIAMHRNRLTPVTRQS